MHDGRGMKLFTCSACRQLLFFENTQCQRCAHRLAYVPHLQARDSKAPADLYPFVLSEPAIAKLRFVHEVIAETSHEPARAN